MHTALSGPCKHGQAKPLLSEYATTILFRVFTLLILWCERTQHPVVGQISGSFIFGRCLLKATTEGTQSSNSLTLLLQAWTFAFAGITYARCLISAHLKTHKHNAAFHRAAYMQQTCNQTPVPCMATARLTPVVQHVPPVSFFILKPMRSCWPW